LRDEIARHFGVKMHERTVGKLLARLNFSRVSGRPRHPGHDLEARQVHEKTSPNSSAPPFPSTHGTSRSSSGGKSEPGQKTVRGTVFPANARIGQQGSLTCVRAERGSRPRAPHDQRTTSALLFGAVCPARGVGAALVLPGVNIAAMNLHLAEISSQIAPGAHAVITPGGAGWHRPGGGLVVPDNISLLPLPPYSPERSRSGASGSKSARTISPTACLTPAAPSPMPAATRGMRSSGGPTPYGPLQPGTGQEKSAHRAVGINAHLM